MDGLKSHVIVAHDLGDVADIVIDDIGGKVRAVLSRSDRTEQAGLLMVITVCKRRTTLVYDVSVSGGLAETEVGFLIFLAIFML